MNPNFVLSVASDWSEILFRPGNVVFIVPLAAITLVLIMGMTKQLIRHRERMAMIERGMHPDHPQEPRGPRDQADEPSSEWTSAGIAFGTAVPIKVASIRRLAQMTQRQLLE